MKTPQCWQDLMDVHSFDVCKYVVSNKKRISPKAEIRMSTNQVPVLEKRHSRASVNRLARERCFEGCWDERWTLWHI
jgi:hypothetical protein